MLELWESEAAAYDAAYDDPGRGGKLVRGRMTVAIELLGEPAGLVLDAGMGGGRLCVELDRLGWTVEGCDASFAMVEMARRRLPGRTQHLVRGRIEALPFSDRIFDAAAALGVVEYSIEVEGALRELARVVRPGGTCVFSFPNFRGLPSLWRRRVLYPVIRIVKRLAPFGRPVPLPPHHVVGEKELLASARQAGLSPLEIVRLGPDGSRAGGLRAAQLVVLARRST